MKIYFLPFIALLSISFILSCKKDQRPKGHSSLIKTTVEPAGTNCQSGGYKIETGIDINDNNILDNSEVTNTSFICNGNNNETGTLINVKEEKPGSNCPNGGYRIETGTDKNKDGILDTNEVTATSFICSSALSYTAIINQSGTAAPQSNILENTLDISITWTRLSSGRYLGTISPQVDLSRTVIMSTNDRWVKCEFQSNHEVFLMNEPGVNGFADNVSNYTLQIKTFK
ncbi:hypothetical protein DVR12_02455 [Chitinophaga silvatica]|uniref:DUF7151 domain-containing protein n=1 Tax=Chitinophaga silvatica TaxID=2282649 RepID=A0A3E1YH00_9BACT|nr:hypothetical protein [Chitinophaga silvatica]RFS26671.1 hypothetical protein DVR12_02455 [Chitinophaga silvatica]